MILPLSTAECERDFSHLNLTKKQTRLCQLLPKIDDLHFVKLHELNLTDFNQHLAIHLQWNDVESGHSRRPNFKKFISQLQTVF